MTLSLLLSLCLVTATQVTAAVILYVDVSHTGTEDGSQANPYNTITEAVTNASAGDTVIVSGGTYAENVAVDKRLIIRAKSGRRQLSALPAVTG
jgi:nitrous oxidase accessory protein NosD